MEFGKNEIGGYFCLHFHKPWVIPVSLRVSSVDDRHDNRNGRITDTDTYANADPDTYTYTYTYTGDTYTDTISQSECIADAVVYAG